MMSRLAHHGGGCAWGAAPPPAGPPRYRISRLPNISCSPQTVAFSTQRKESALRAKRLKRDPSLGSLGLSRDPSRASLGGLRAASLPAVPSRSSRLLAVHRGS